MWQVGYLGIWQTGMSSPGAWQVLIDLVLMSRIALGYMWHDAQRGPGCLFALVTLAAGSFGPMLYLLLAPRHALARTCVRLPRSLHRAAPTGRQAGPNGDRGSVPEQPEVAIGHAGVASRAVGQLRNSFMPWSVSGGRHRPQRACPAPGDLARRGEAGLGRGLAVPWPATIQSMGGSAA